MLQVLDLKPLVTAAVAVQQAIHRWLDLPDHGTNAELRFRFDSHERWDVASGDGDDMADLLARSTT